MASRDERERDVIAREDLEEEHPHVGFGGIDEEEDPLRLQSHQWRHPHDRAHVSLTEEEYTPEEVARLLGTSIENIIHAVRNGDLKAERAGHDVICIQRHDLLDWLKRGGGV